MDEHERNYLAFTEQTMRIKYLMGNMGHCITEVAGYRSLSQGYEDKIQTGKRSGKFNIVSVFFLFSVHKTSFCITIFVEINVFSSPITNRFHNCFSLSNKNNDPATYDSIATTALYAQIQNVLEPSLMLLIK